MTALSNLLAILSLDDSEYLKGITGAEAQTNTFTQNLSNVGGAIVVGGLAAIGGAIVGVGDAAWNAGNTVDEAMDQIAQKTGATGPKLQGLQKDFETVFSSVPTDAPNAAAAIGTLNAQLDITGPTLQKLAEPLLEVSRMTGGDVKTNAENFGKVIQAWDLPIDQASTSLDKMYVAAQQTGAPLDAIMQSVITSGPALRTFGLSFDQSTALLAKWTSEGVQTDQMLAGLRIAAGNFAKENIPMQQGLWDTVNAIQGAKTQTEAMDIAMKAFGSRGAVTMVDAIRSGKFNIDDLVGSMQSADGQIMKTAQSTMDWGERWQMFQNKMTTALAPLGQKMMSAAEGALDQFESVFERPDVQTTLMQFTDMIGNVITQAITYIPLLINGFFQFITFLQNNQGIVIGILAALGVAAIAWGVTTAGAAITAMMPFLPVIAVLIAVGAAAYLLYQAWQTDWGGIQEKTAAVWAWLQPIFTGLLSWLQTNIPVALQMLSNFWTNILLPALQAVGNFWMTVLLPALQNFWSYLNTYIFPVLGALANLFSAVLGIAITLIAAYIEKVLVPDFQIMWSFISQNVIPIVSALAGWFMDKLAPAFARTAEIVKGVVSWINQLANALRSIHLPTWMTPGSPTPWEIGLAGVRNELDALSRSSLPQLQTSLTMQPVGLTSSAPVVSTATGAGAAANGNDAMQQEIYRMLRELPNTLQRANRDMIEKVKRY